MIKLFEDFKLSKLAEEPHNFDFNVGDIVYCINTEVTTSLYKDEKYKVLNIDDEYIKINNGTNNRYWKYRFISELEYNTKNYNL